MSLTKVSYAMTNGSPVNVLDFGAVGDGTTDDTVAIQAAINSLPTNGGAVYLPAGNYLISSTLTQTKRLFLFGDGVSNVGGDVGSTQITKAASMTTPAITLSINGSCIQDLDFRGNTGNTGDGIQISCARSRLSNVGVYTMGQDGVRVGTDAGVNCNVYYFEQLKCKSNTRYGLHLSDRIAPSLPDANAGTISGADFQANGSHGFYINNSRIGAYSGITAQNNTGILYFYSASSAQNLTTNGKTINCPIIVGDTTQAPTLVCQDALTQNSTRAFTITNGTVQLKAGATSTVGAFATSGTKPKFLQSTTAGSQATLFQASGTVGVSYLTIQDIRATGGATWNSFYANNNVDAGNNTNWNFGGTPSYDAEYGYKLRSFTEHGRF